MLHPSLAPTLGIRGPGSYPGSRLELALVEGDIDEKALTALEQES